MGEDPPTRAPHPTSRGAPMLVGVIAAIVLVPLGLIAVEAIPSDLQVGTPKPPPYRKLEWHFSTREACDPETLYRVAPCTAAESERVGEPCVVPIHGEKAERLAARRLDLSWLDLPPAHLDATRTQLLRGEMRIRGKAERDALQVSEIVGPIPPGAIAAEPAGIRDIATDGTDVWIAGGFGIYRVPAKGGPKTALVPGDVSHMARANGVMVLSRFTGVEVMRDGDAAPRQIAERDVLALTLDAERAYAVRREGAIVSIPLEGGAETRIAEAPSFGSVAVDDRFVYWTEYTAKKVMRAPKTGGPATLVAEVVNARSVVAAPGRVVWSSWVNLDGGIGAAYADGRVVPALVPGQWAPGAVSASADTIAWVASDDGGPRGLRVLREGTLVGTREMGWNEIATAIARDAVFVATRCLQEDVVFRVPLPPK